MLAILLVLTGCASERFIRVTGDAPENVVLGVQGTDQKGALEVALPWLRLNVTAANGAECGSQLVQVFGGQFVLLPQRFAFSVGDFPAVAVISDANPPVITAEQASTAVRVLAGKLSDKCLRSAQPGVDFNWAAAVSAETIMAALPRYANSELAIIYGLSLGAGASWVDIVPGMRLKISTSDLIQYITDQSAQRYFPGVRDFILPRLRSRGLGATRQWELDPAAELGDLGDNKVAIGEIFDRGIATVAGVQDLRVPSRDSAEKSPTRYWRLYQPASGYVSNNVGLPLKDAEPLSNSTVIVATNQPDSLPNRALVQSDCTAPSDESKRALTCFEFRARGSVVPEINIFVQHVQRWVTLGTRISDIAAEAFPLAGSEAPPATDLAARAWIDGAIYNDWAARAWTRIRVRRQVGNSDAELTLAASGEHAAAAAMSIPLVAGDSLTW